MMVDSVWMAGCAIGVCTQLFHNSIMRVPLTRWPYMHVLLGVGGGYALQFIDSRAEEAKVKVLQKQKDEMERNIQF